MADRKALCLTESGLAEIGTDDRQVLSGDPLAALHAAPKRYVDTSITQYPLDVGEETFPREFLISSVATISQSLRLSYFFARKSEITTQVKMISGTTPAGATPTLVQIALYLIAANGDGTLVASTVNDTALFAAASSAYTRSWSASYAKVAGQYYALGSLVVSAAALPTMAGLGLLASGSSESGLAPRMQGVIGSQATLPSAFTAASVGGTTGRYYGAILP